MGLKNNFVQKIVMKKTSIILAILLSSLGYCQGIHVGEQVWTPNTLDKLYNAGLYNHYKNTISIDSFDYTVDESKPNDAHFWIINNKFKVIKDWKLTHPGVNVNVLLRCSRTRGAKWDFVPDTEVEQNWWADFVATKVKTISDAKLGDVIVGGWNERSLLWFPSNAAEVVDRPERQALLTSKLISSVKKMGVSNFKILSPSSHSVNNGTPGQGITYLKRFFAALPASDRQYVSPDFHLYYGFLSTTINGIVLQEYTDLSQTISYLSGIGYKPEDCYVSEFGCNWYSATQLPTSSQIAQRAFDVYKTAQRAGIPADHMYCWSDGSNGIMAVFDANGNLTPYGNYVKTIMK
jgi:hypothetical protein